MKLLIDGIRRETASMIIRKSFQRHSRLLVAVILCAAASRFAIAQQPAPSAGALPAAPVAEKSVDDAPAVRSDELYRIGPGDVLDIIVLKNSALSRDGVRVDNNGMVQVPLIQDAIQAACLTERELAADIKRRLLRYLRNPQVYVAIKEYNSQPVAVIGAVNTPGRFQLQRRLRLLELLTFVNGPSDRAGRSVQIVHTAKFSRCDTAPAATNDETSMLASYNLKDTLQADEKANPYLHPGDIVRLPEADQAFIVGSVKLPKEIVLREPVTVSQAIAMAGGTLPEANGEKIRIIRQQPGTLTKTEIFVNLKMINKHQRDDVALQANDVVDVPGPSGSKKILQTLMTTLVPTMATYPLRVIR